MQAARNKQWHINSNKNNRRKLNIVSGSRGNQSFCTCNPVHYNQYTETVNY